MHTETARRYSQRLEAYFNINGQNQDEIVSAEKLSKIMQVSEETIASWRKKNEVRCVRDGNVRGYRLGHVAEDLKLIIHGAHLDTIKSINSHLTKTPYTGIYQVSAVQVAKNGEAADPVTSLSVRGAEGIPLQVPDEPLPSSHANKPKYADFESVRLRALEAAKQAYRDVILEAADKAKQKGELEFQVSLLRDFIFAEEGLKVIYENGARDGISKKHAGSVCDFQ